MPTLCYAIERRVDPKQGLGRCPQRAGSALPRMRSRGKERQRSYDKDLETTGT